MKTNEYLNYIYYIFKRNSWMLDPRMLINFKKIKIDKPIFLLGVQGGGLTLISRMLRRNKKVVSVTGNSNYWAGADEMQNVFGPILPSELTGIKYKITEHEEIKKNSSWKYASNGVINDYRNTENDVTKKLRSKIKKIIRYIIKRYGDNSDIRFIDKSQIYTIKVSFINELLKTSDPRFVLITRNPYAVCYRAPKISSGLKNLPNEYSHEDKLRLAAEHWKNSNELALKDGKKVDNFMVMKFESVLMNPKKQILKLCEFCNLKFNHNMIPQKNHKNPFGSLRRKRWYPLRKNVNKKYFEKMSKEEYEIIDNYCGELAENFGYKKPKFENL